MSIIRGRVQEALWNDANASLSEDACTELFNYVFNKILFPEEMWSIGPEQLGSGNQKLRADVVIRNLATNAKVVVVVNCKPQENRGEISRSCLYEAESQALFHCLLLLESIQQRKIFAITTYGTNMKCWVYDEVETTLTPLPGFEGAAATAEGYIGIHSTKANAITDVTKLIKNANLSDPASASSSGS